MSGSMETKTCQCQPASHADELKLLSLIHETIEPLTRCEEILQAGVQKIARHKGIPFAVCGTIEQDCLTIVVSADGPVAEGQQISLEPVRDLLHSKYLDSEASARLVLPEAFAFSASETLLLPFRSRFIPDGMFMFACDDSCACELKRALHLLSCAVDTIVMAMDRAMVISELKRMNATLDRQVEQRTRQLNESEAQYRSLIDQAMDGIVVFDAGDGHFLDVNAAACRSLGYSKRELLALKMSDIVADEFGGGFNALIDALKEKGTIITEGAHRRKDGTTFPVETHLGMILLKGEVCVLAISHDITESREIEEQLLQAQKMESIGTLVGGIAHDFNNMLAGMMGNLYLIEHDDTLSGEGKQKAERIHELCERAANMITQLLTFARRGTIQMQPLEFGHFMSKAIKLATLGIPENIEVIRDLKCKESLSVMGDHTQLQQLLLNLMVNARDAVQRSEKPAIRVSLQRIESSAKLNLLHPGLAEGPWLELAVADNGCGIPESIREQLFDPFFTTKAVGEGTGLGLSTVYGVVQSHQGAIEVDSRENEGSVFRIYLPLHAEHVEETAELDGDVPQGHGETILIVDDEEIVLTTTSALLMHLGYQVIQAHNGCEALSKEGLEDVDLALLDIVMPEMGGVEAAQRLRTQYPDLPIIFATAYDQDLVLNKGSQLPASRVLSKPFRLKKLSTTIHELITPH